MLKGLTSQEVDRLQKQYGKNIIEDEKKGNLLHKFFGQFANFLVLLLLVAALLSFFIGEFLDGSLILMIVFLNVIFGVYQENKAEQAVKLLRTLTIANIRTIRDGKEVEIDSRDLVPGDVFFIEEGLKIPADAKIVESFNLELNEAALTGESIPVVKGLADEVFMGTIVSRGRGWVEVVSIGMKTRFGEIAAELMKLEDGKTPLQKKLENITEIIGIMGIVLSLAIFALSAIQGHGYLPSFLLAVSLAVAIVPEGLPAVMTITLAIGVKDMAKKKAIIRKMSAIEALGSITLIATDKTGTLTENDMKVNELFVNGKIYDSNKLPDNENTAFHRLILNGILCSTASLVYMHDHGIYKVLGDPTEGAMLHLAKKLGHELELIKKDWQVLDEIPFDQVEKRMSVTVKKGKEIVTYTKGAPEKILEVCTHILIDSKPETLSEEKKEEIYHVLDQWAHKGLRVLGFAYNTENNLADVAYSKMNRQVFLGLVAIHDPPRAEVKDSIKKAYEAGIKVVMITGDNEKTAEAIGRSIGLVQEGDIILKGEQIEKYTDEELLEFLPKTKIFARTTPLHKSRIVSLYQKMGEVVAVTGDGVNDSIALKQADVGIAMGRIGTDVARDASDMVITDDNFTTIVIAIEEGRNTIKNIKNSIKYLLAGNLSEGLSLLIAFMIGLPPIFIPIQLLYINLLSDGLPALFLAFSPRDKHVMKKNPDKKTSLLNTFDRSYIILIGLFASLIVVATYLVFAKYRPGMEKTAAFTVLAIIQSFIFADTWLTHRSFRDHYGHFISKFFFLGFFLPYVCQVIIIYVPALAIIFNLQQVDFSIFLVFIAMASYMLVVIKGVKVVLHRITPKEQH